MDVVLDRVKCCQCLFLCRDVFKIFVRFTDNEKSLARYEEDYWMTPIQEQRTLEFVNRIARDIELVPRQNGYDLQKPGSTRIGYVRYNIRGKGKDRYRVYAYEPFSDPRGLFDNDHANPTRGWTCVVDPGNESDMRYVISVLESPYDQK